MKLHTILAGMLLLGLPDSCTALAVFRLNGSTSNARSIATAELPDPHCSTGLLSVFKGGEDPQVCCPGYCGECSNYPTCKNVRGQDSTNACCARNVYEMRCGNAPANKCLKSCSESTPPCIMELPEPPKVYMRTASSDCGKAKKIWKLQEEAATGGTAGADPADATKKLDAAVDKAAAKVAGLGEFSILVGDAHGIHYAKKGKKVDASGFAPSSLTKPQRVFSTTKWATGAALGAAVNLGLFSWDDPVSKYIKWWAKDPKDPRSNITFAHCLSHTSGLIMSTGFAKALDLQALFKNADVGYNQEGYTLEDSARLAFKHTGPDIPKPPSEYRYGETHYFVAQFAACQASGIDTWSEFFAKYWGAPLGLQLEIEDPEHEKEKAYFKSGDPYAYGFHLNKADAANNPDGGSAIIISPCGYSRFLTSYLRNGEMMWNANAIDKVHADTGFWSGFGLGNQYALGHWILDSGPLKGVHHSMGFGGTSPFVIPGTKPFWIYVSRFQEGSMTPSTLLVSSLISDIKQFMKSSPRADTSICPS